MILIDITFLLIWLIILQNNQFLGNDINLVNNITLLLILR